MNEPTFQYDFFIAYASTDKVVAENLFNLLSPASKVFLDTKCLKLGDDWDLELHRAQRKSRITIVLISYRTQTAYYQREEIASAINMSRKGGHRVVPLYLDGYPDEESQIPYGLRLKHGISIPETKGIEDVAHRLNELILELKKQADSVDSDEGQRASRAKVEALQIHTKQTTINQNTKNHEKSAKTLPEYLCYISRDKIDQLCGNLDCDTPINDRSLTEGNILPINKLVNSDIPYGRSDVFQLQSNLKRAYGQKLKKVLLAHADHIEIFDWSIKIADADNIFYWVKASFSIKAIDEEHLMAELIAKNGRKTLILHCSLRNFSAEVEKNGRPFFHSTNYAFFHKQLDVTFESVFYLLSSKGNKFYGSPLYLKLSLMRDLLL